LEDEERELEKRLHDVKMAKMRKLGDKAPKEADAVALRDAVLARWVLILDGTSETRDQEARLKLCTAHFI